jgi:hypothetical protein
MNPIPSIQAILTCEKIIVEAGSGKKSLISIFTGVHHSGLFPFSFSMALYVRLTDCEGRYVFRVDVVHLQSDKRIGSATLPGVESTDRLTPMEVVIQIPRIDFQEAGKYEFQIYGDDVFLGHTSVDVLTVEGGEKPNAGD